MSTYSPIYMKKWKQSHPSYFKEWSNKYYRTDNKKGIVVERQLAEIEIHRKEIALHRETLLNDDEMSELL